MKRILSVFIIMLLTVAALPAFAQDEEPGTIAEVASATEDFSTLVAALDAAGLVSTFADEEAEFTVFAPNNGAFDTLLTDMEIEGDDFLADTDMLTSVLTYHVLPGTFLAADVLDAIEASEDGTVSLTTVNGADLTFSLSEDNVVLINDGEASISETDIPASNGVIHIIDNVLVPMDDMMDDMDEDDEMMDEDMEMSETIVDIAAATEDFSTLVAAVQAAGLVDTLSEGEFTVFAPTNGAFDTLLTDMEMTGEELLANTDLLTAVLLYHVVEGTVFSGDLAGMVAETERCDHNSHNCRWCRPDDYC